MKSLSLLLNLLLLSNVCHSMEPQDFKNIADLNDFENRIIKNLTESEIISFTSQGSIVELQLKIENPVSHQLIRFTRNYSKNGVLYLTPLYEDAQEPATMEASAYNYRLLYLAEGGHVELIGETLEHGANPLARDQRLARPIFNILRRNRSTLYTREDLQNGRRPFRLIPSTRPVIAVHPYSSYNLTAIEHAMRQCNLKTVEAFRKTCEDVLPDDVLARIQFDINIDKLLKKLEKEQRTIQQAQAHAAIPTFPILPASDSTDPSFVGIQSEDDPELNIRAQIDKDTCILEFQSNPKQWKTSYLDLDALSTLYSHLILTNEIEGTRVLNSFDRWSKYNLFTIRVIRYVLDNLKPESYDNQPLLPENITQFAQRIARYTNTIQQTINPLQSEHLVGMTLCVCAARSYNQGGICIDPQWRASTDKLVENLTSEPNTKQLCIKICENNKPLFFVPAIKTSMQRALLHRYCIRILSQITPHLDTALIERILSYWKPDNKFIDVIRKYKENSKKSSIKKAFHAIVHKK